MRSVAILLAWLICSVTFGQAVAWTYTVQNTSEPKVGRDSLGNLYLATREGTLTTVKAYLYKLTPSGQLDWKTEVFSRSNTKSIRINDVAVDADRAYVLIERTAGSINATAEGCEIAAVNLSSGVREWIRTSAHELHKVFAGGPNLVGIGTSLESVVNDRRGHFVRINKATGTVAFDLPYGTGRTTFIDACQDETSLIHVVGSSYVGLAMVVSYTDYGTIRWSIGHGMTGYPDVTGGAITALNSAGRIYIAAHGLHPTTMINNIRYMRLDMADGSKDDESLTTPGVSEIPIALACSNTALYSVVQQAGSGPNTTYRIMNADLEVQYSTSPTAPGGSTPMILADSYGDGIASYAFLGPNSFDATTQCFAPIFDPGTVWIHVVGTNDSINQTPSDALVDPAGNVFVAGTVAGNGFLMKIQPAVLVMANNIVTGGATAACEIQMRPRDTAGATFTLTSGNPALAVVPPTVTVPQFGPNVGFNITTTPVTTNTNVAINARYRGIVLQSTLTIAAPLVTEVTIAPNSVFGGVNTVGTVKISGKAPVGGKVVSLGSDLTSAATVPASTTIAAGVSAKTFIITTLPVSANKGVVISATTGIVTKTAFMAVNAAWLINLGVSPASVTGGSGATVTATLNGKAPTAGYSVQLVSGAPAVVITPSSLAVPSGLLTGSIGINTSAVTTSINVTLVGYRGPYIRTTTLTVNP